MRTPAALAIAAFCSVTFFAQIGSAQEKRPVDRERRDCAGWVAKCLADFKAIRVGMTRSEIEARFPQDGGLQTVSPVRYTHRSCGYFKIDVEFAFKRKPADQGRAILSPDDKVVRVSKAYIETPCFD